MTAVSRSTYQKVVEENKRLKEDIRIMVGRSIDYKDFKKRDEVRTKWISYFREQEQLHSCLKQAAEQYFKDHPELNPIKANHDQNNKPAYRRR